MAQRLLLYLSTNEYIAATFVILTKVMCIKFYATHKELLIQKVPYFGNGFVKMRLLLKSFFLIGLATVASSSYAYNAKQIRAIAKSIGLGTCEGGSFAPISKDLASQEVSKGGLTIQDLIDTAAIVKSLESITEKKLSEKVFVLQSGDGYRHARASLIKKLNDLKNHPKFYEIELPSFKSFSFSGLGLIAKINYEYLTSSQIVQKLESQLESEHRIGYFPMLAREIIMFEHFFLDGSLKATAELTASENYGSWLMKFFKDNVSQIQARALSFPYPDHFGDVEMALTWALGVVPLGIRTQPKIFFDTNTTESSYVYANHDDIHFSASLRRFLLKAKYDNSHHVVAQFLLDLANLESDKDVVLITFFWMYATHELNLLDNMNSEASLSAMLQAGQNITLNNLVKRIKNPIDMYEGVPPYLRQLLDSGNEAKLTNELKRGLDLLYSMFVE